METGVLTNNFTSYVSPFHWVGFSIPCKPKFPVVMVIVGKGRLHWATQEWASGLEHFLTKRWRAHTACAELIASCVNILPYFMLNMCSFVLLKCVCKQPIGTHLAFSISDFMWRVRVLLQQHERDVHRSIAILAAQEGEERWGAWGAAGHGWPTLLKLILLCLFSR